MLYPGKSGFDASKVPRHSHRGLYYYLDILLLRRTIARCNFCTPVPQNLYNFLGPRNNL